MKLTVTNSSIGLIVLIVHVHQTHKRDQNHLRYNQSKGLKPYQLLNCCVSPTWWLLRGGRTRSLSEHGRETPLRQWYSVLRRGRVGRCQVCQTQQSSSQCKTCLSHEPEQPLHRFNAIIYSSNVRLKRFNEAAVE